MAESFFAIIALVLWLVAGYASYFFSKQFWLEDYSKMNHWYKETLFYTGQNKLIESKDNLGNFKKELSIFESKYSDYRPVIIRYDEQYLSDMKKVQELVDESGLMIEVDKLSEAHLKLEEVRSIFQNILKRNNYSVLGIALVDFHDSMEKILDSADKKDVAELLKQYNDADEKLKAVEMVSNDSEIQQIRKELELIKKLAEENQLDKLSDQATKLKSSYVKVYLKRG